MDRFGFGIYQVNQEKKTMRVRIFLGLVLLLGWGCAAEQEPQQPGSTTATNRPMPEMNYAATPSSVIVHLFEWRWDDVAEECEAFLGPKGYHAVQVSPPTENSVVDGRPWWEKYQPASYTFDNRSGDRAAFVDMVQRCNNAGVEIYVDAVINHMTGAYEGIGTAGTEFGLYEYPGLYTYDDFHHCGLTSNDDIEDWNDPVQVRTCELVNLTDLATENDNVRDTIAGYLNDLVSLGVAGIRIDAARHMAPEDIRAILDRVDGELYVYQEVIDPQPPTWSEPYYQNGIVTEFQYSQAVSNVFFNGSLAELHGPGSIWSRTTFLPTDKAFVFVDNHDNQRGHGAGGHIVTHKDGDLYNLAQVFALAYPYGQVRVMSSYQFEDGAQGPPALADETVKRVHQADGSVNCAQGEWECEHRREAIANMVAFRNATAGTGVDHWWSEGRDQIAFARGDKGFVAINRSDASMEQALQTGLPAGTYCNVFTGIATETGCTGETVTVQADGTAAIAVAPMQALALHADARSE